MDLGGVIWATIIILAAAYMAKRSTERKIARYITARMKTVSPSLSAAQALDDLRMAVESGDYEATPCPTHQCQT